MTIYTKGNGTLNFLDEKGSATVPVALLCVSRSSAGISREGERSLSPLQFP
jgi:hypothetical protein